VTPRALCLTVGALVAVTLALLTLGVAAPSLRALTTTAASSTE
jgi:hypothetical protein